MSRWTHPTLGIIAPSVFIPLAEQIGQIGPFGVVTFRRICREMACWPEIRTFVNVSAIQIRRPGFLDRVKAILDGFGIDGSRFEIELTKSCPLDKGARTRDVLLSLRSLGFKLSLDDFGTGFSSLGYPTRFSINRIKNDRSFVFGLRDGPQSVAIIEAVAHLVRVLRLKLVAEGVKTQEQLRTLMEVGVEIFQGFLFSKPLPIQSLSTVSERCSCYNPLREGA